MIQLIKNVFKKKFMDMLERVYVSFRKRLECCANSRGSHFENVYH